ncbi:hypothetical protein TEA_024259 [Camellia sinensis var. sinensis]|uniref:ACB domain-containing protein n=1 Tax=Camellia sinensis var. sinensis TaxID=542762 RepID=A0A4V3WK17_CAMSN|nr:hypothetical protein TEA_024259 [Camellia sinensis var. sinensis]
MSALVSALSASQDKMGTGYLSAFPSEQFDRFEAIKPVWAPYYTIHKIMAGLLDQYILAENVQALKMLTWMVDYFYNRVLNVITKYSEDFEEHAEKAKTLPESTTNESKLILYGLYKQATVGPINTSRPGMFNMRDRAKWDAWKAVEGKSKDEAMSDYITKVKQLLEEATASA